MVRFPNVTRNQQMLYFAAYITKARRPMSEPPLALGQYIEQARERLVRLRGPGDSTWREIVETGLAAAYQSGDISGLGQVVQFLVNLLESRGRFEDAEAEIDLALKFAAADPGSAAALMAL